MVYCSFFSKSYGFGRLCPKYGPPSVFPTWAVGFVLGGKTPSPKCMWAVGFVLVLKPRTQNASGQLGLYLRVKPRAHNVFEKVFRLLALRLLVLVTCGHVPNISGTCSRNVPNMPLRSQGLRESPLLGLTALDTCSQHVGNPFPKCSQHVVHGS